MTLSQEVRDILTSTLGLSGRTGSLSKDTRLLGSLPEFDSMAVVSVVTALEEHYGFTVDDDELDAETFETVGSLCDFVQAKLEA